MRRRSLLVLVALLGIGGIIAWLAARDPTLPPPLAESHRSATSVATTTSTPSDAMEAQSAGQRIVVATSQGEQAKGEEAPMHRLIASLFVTAVDDLGFPLADIGLSTHFGPEQRTDASGRAEFICQPLGQSITLKSFGVPNTIQLSVAEMEVPLMAIETGVVFRMTRQARLVLELSDDFVEQLSETEHIQVVALRAKMGLAKLSREAPSAARWLDAGRWQFTASTADDVPIAHTTLQFNPGTTTRWLVESIRGPHSLKGRALDPQGRGIDGVLLKLWFPEFTRGKTAISASDGRFTFANLPSTTDARLSYSPPSGSSWSYDGTGEQDWLGRRLTIPSRDVDVTLQPGFTIEGTTNERESPWRSRRTPQVEIDWALRRNEPMKLQPDEGRCSFRHLRPGIYHLRLTGQTEWTKTVVLDDTVPGRSLTLIFDVD